MVYLVQKNIKIKEPSNKLDFKKMKLFKIDKVILITNYRLSLPKTIKIHLVFYILLLKLVLKDAFIKEEEEVDKEDKQEVERVLDIRSNKDGIISFLVKQKDYNKKWNK